MVKEIKLSVSGYVALVDDEDFEELNKLSWQLSSFNHTNYATSGYYNKDIGKITSKRMHRMVMKVSDTKSFIDHIDHNGLNNQKSNLRICSPLENSQNRSRTKGRKYKGISYRRDCSMWRVELSANKIAYKFGDYETEEEAAAVYDVASKILHGEFSYPNFPEIKTHPKYIEDFVLNRIKEKIDGEVSCIDHYMHLTRQTAIYPKAGTGDIEELIYLCLGLSSEAGEVAGLLKKRIRDGGNDEEFKESLIKEIGDNFWYLVRLCDYVGQSPRAVLTRNINKLQSRKDRGKLSGSGDNR